MAAGHKLHGNARILDKLESGIFSTGCQLAPSLKGLGENISSSKQMRDPENS